MAVQTHKTCKLLRSYLLCYTVSTRYRETESLEEALITSGLGMSVSRSGEDFMEEEALKWGLKSMGRFGYVETKGQVEVEGQM